MRKTTTKSATQSPEGGLAAKAPGEPISKNDDMDQDDEFGDEDEGDEDEGDEDEGDEDEMKKKAKKSETIEGDLLMKSLDSLQAAADQSALSTDRRAELADKLAKGAATSEEREELGRLLSGTDDDDSLGKSFSEAAQDDEAMREAFEASAFIAAQSELIAKSLDGLAGRLNKAQSSQHTFNTALAKSFHDLGGAFLQQQELIKSQQAQLQAVSARLGIVERTPQPRRAATAPATPLAKSFIDGQGEAQLTPQQISVGLDRLLAKSAENNWMLPCGEPIDLAVAKFETSGRLSEGVERDIRKALAEGQSA